MLRVVRLASYRVGTFCMVLRIILYGCIENLSSLFFIISIKLDLFVVYGVLAFVRFYCMYYFFLLDFVMFIGCILIVFVLFSL